MSFNDKDIIIERFYLNVVFKSIVFLYGTLNETLAALNIGASPGTS